MKVIDFNNVCEKYRIKFVKQKNVCWEEVWVLRDINFQAEEGDIIGIIGKNGAGKTTLLKLIAGMLVPDKGEIHVRGKVSALMELGAGFNPEFTGIENINLNAAIYGLSEGDLRQRMDNIIKFANLGKFIDAPIKYYSQGMYMRLAFALAIFVEPDILLIDDILAVGDEEAQQKCIKKIFELKQMRKTIILVSHNMDVVSKLCNRIILLEKGRFVRENLTTKVIPFYLETIGNEKGIAVLKKDRLRITFNNGKIILNYNDFPLTETTGGYASFFIPSLNSWFSSLNLFWQIKSFETGKIIAEGKSHEGVLSQTWTLQIEKNCFKWQIEINDKTIKQQHADLLLIPQYKRWETLDRNGDFPFFISKSNWHDLGLISFPDAILGLSGSWQRQDHPGLVLEQEDRKNTFKIFNTGYEQEARVIQWRLDSKNKNLILIKLFSEKDKFIKYIENVKQKFLKKEAEKQQKLLKKEKEKQQKLLIKQRQELFRLRLQRTISEGSLRLYADVEEKSLRLFYKDKEITRMGGLHSSFLVKNIWYDLSSGQWQVKKRKNALILRLYWKQLRFRQIWRFSFKDNAFFWRASFEVSQLPEIKLLKFGLFLNSQYKDFFCGRQQDKFSRDFNNWQDISLVEPRAKLCGMRKHDNFPAIVLENRGNYSCIIQNSDEQAQCRALQLSFPEKRFKQKKASFSTLLHLLEDESLINDYLKQEEEKFLKKEEEEKQRFLKKEEEKQQRLLKKKKEEQQRRLKKEKEKQQKLLIKQRQELSRLRLQRTISEGSLRLYADVEEKSLRLFYKDKEITQGKGVNNSFLFKTDWYDLTSGQWQLKKVSNEKLILSVNYENLMILQVWTLVCRKDALMIKIKTKFNKPALGSNQLVFLHLCGRYEEWESAYEHGNFLNEQYINDIASGRLKDNKITEILFKSKGKDNMPKLIFSIFSQSGRRTMNIHRYKQANNNVPCIEVVCDKEKSTKSDNAVCFEGKITLGESVNIKKNIKKINFIKLVNNNLELVFKQGKGEIFLSGKELTSGLGLYTSIRSLGVWRDSYQAFWRVNQKKNNELKVTGHWPHIAFSQIWQIKMAGDNLILWQVEMEALERLDFEICQANIMLCPQYKKWAASGHVHGDFLDEYTKEYDILPFRFWYGRAEKIAAKAKALPEICFMDDTKKKDTRAIIENTDDLYQARLLQYQKASTHKILPGRYPYFKGRIKIKLPN